MGAMTMDQHMTLALSPQYGFSGSRGYINKLIDAAEQAKDGQARNFANKLNNKVDGYYGE